MLDLNNFAKEIHSNAEAHGWWEEERKFPEIVALCHSELSEALEEYRDDKPMCYYQVGIDFRDIIPVLEYPKLIIGEKPEGMAVEMADCIIRILDWCGKEGIDIEAILRAKHEYNKGRPYKHGWKKA